LQDIPPHLISGGDLWQGEDSQLATALYSWNKMPAAKAVRPELSAGDHVQHAQFGDGIVVSVQPAKDDAEVVVAFDGAGIKKLLLSFAGLEKIA